jgi:YD repeat-containing protein
MSALRITEAVDGSPVVSVAATSRISGAANLQSDDLYGDGHEDSMLYSSPEFGLRDSFGILVKQGQGVVVPESQSPRTLPGGLPIFTGKVLLNEGGGPGGAKNADGITPQTQDMLASVTDGFGQQILWSYAPLAGKAGRTAGQTPLYTVPTVASQRYIDESHIYFTSSMQVVAEMKRSDALGGFHTTRYGYGEAMYHTQGRGFQGFRTIIEEELTTGLRTTTTFHQKFPLTSQPERITVNPLTRSGEQGPISQEFFTWRCDRGNRGNANACVAVAGAPTRYFPFLDIKDSYTYDATVAAAGGTPSVLGYTQEVAALDSACTGSYSSVSGFDAHGNLGVRTVHRRDLGTGSGGAAGRLDRQCVRESNTYAPDTANWWLDKLTAQTVTTQVTWDAQHPLPAGASAPSRTVTTEYAWNADRTLASETFQPGVANQQRVTAYTYPASGNYGLPSGLAVAAAGDPNGTRSTGTTYTADGYFPLAVVNALGHSATTEVRPRDGQPLRVTDANGLRTLIDYDAFGFAVRKRFRGATDAVYLAPDQLTSMVRCTMSFCWNSTEQYQITQVQDGAPTQVSRFDALGRPWMQAQKQQDGVWSHVMLEYTPRGQVAWQTEPFRTGDAIVSTAFQYNDVLGRMTRKQAPKQGIDGRGDLVTTYSYNGRTTAIQVCGSNDAPGGEDCLNLNRTTDSLGRYVETRDALNGRTRFWYESNGNVAAIEDAKGVVTRASYNSIGQRTGVNDPNQGAWSFAYNALGEVLSQTDARGIATSMTYDKLGRPTSRSANVDVTGEGTPDAVFDSWNYDPANAKGALDAESRQINWQHERWRGVSYDSLARPVQTMVVQALASTQNTYVFRSKYDSYYGRPIGQEFPNGEAVQVL